MLKKLLLFGFALVLNACAANHTGSIIPQTTTPLSLKSLSAGAHYLYVSAQCSSTPDRNCINTYRYNNSAHTLTLLRRLVVPVNIASFALDKNGDIVVGTNDGVFYYHHDDSSFAPPFRKLYTPTAGMIAISGNDTFFVTNRIGGLNQRIYGYKDASALTEFGVPSIRHSCTPDNISWISCGGFIAADAYNNVFQQVQACTLNGEDCLLGWRASDSEPSFNNGGNGCLALICEFYYQSVTFDPDNAAVTMDRSFNTGVGYEEVTNTALFTPLTIPEPMYDLQFPETSIAPPIYDAATDDGVDTIFLSRYYGHSKSGAPYGEIVMLDYHGNYLGRLTNIAPAQMLYR